MPYPEDKKVVRKILDLDKRGLSQRQIGLVTGKHQKHVWRVLQRYKNRRHIAAGT